MFMFPDDAFADTITTTIPLTTVPRGVLVNPNTNMIYVANYDDGNLTVIDGVTNNIVNTIEVESYPAGAAVNPITNKIYVTHYDIYATYSDKGNVTVIDGSTNSIIKKIQVGINPLGVAVNPATNKVYVSDSLGNQLFEIDGSTDTIINTIYSGEPGSVEVNPITNRIYVSERCYLIVIDGSSNTLMTKFSVSCPLPAGPVNVNPDTNIVYVNSRYAVVVVDGFTNDILAYLSSGCGAPSGAKVNPATNKVYVTCNTSKLFSVFNGTTNSLMQTIQLNGYARGMAINPITNKIYIAIQNPNNILVIDGSINSPSPPQNLSASAVSSSHIDLSWTAPQNDGNSPIRGYQIEKSTDGGFTWSTIVSDTGNSETTYSDTGLDSNTTYTYRVSAINNAGTSSPSNTASATTLATITVNTTDVLNNSLEGIWMQMVSADGTIIAEGFTPITFDVVQGTHYTVYANNYNQHIFVYWENGSMDSSRDVAPTEDMVMTATYTITTVDQLVP